MNLRTASSLFREGRLWLLWKVTSLFRPFYRVSFVASAASCGLLGLLRSGPRPFGALARELAPDPSAEDALRAWLALGVRLGELGEGPDGYRLVGYLSRELSHPDNDDVAALVSEVVTLHHRLIVETPGRLGRRALWAPDEHDGCLIARSSRILEPFVFQAQGRVVPASGPASLLDVGCGAGTYLCHAASLNPALRAVGIEVRPAVAAEARDLVRRRGLSGRIAVETCDVRERRRDETFDVVTLHNAIYYFPVAERVSLLAGLSSFLRPGGRLLITTSCRGGGSPGMAVLDLWTSSTVGSGPLPTKDQLVAQMREAGLVDVEVTSLVPGEPYFAFTASKGPAAGNTG